MLPADLRQVGIRSGGLRALRVLEVCPMLPADAFGPMVGLVSRSVGYKQLARLRAQGLAEVRNEDLGFLLGDRRRGLWSITDLGRRALHGAHEDEHPDPLAPRTTQRRQRLNRQLPLRVACYWLLSCFVVEGREQGEVLEVQGWEFPWVAEFQLVKDETSVRVKLPAAAYVTSHDARDPALRSIRRLLLLPDLGTAPVGRYQRVLGRIIRHNEQLKGEPPNCDELLVATPDPDGRGRA